MKPRIFLPLLLLLFCLPQLVAAQTLDAKTLVGWCQDARDVFYGLSGTPILRQDQKRSNATACAAYLRGWLEREVNMRTELPLAYQCTGKIDDNASLVNNFLKMTDQPNYPQKDINAMLADFGTGYCPPLPAKTQVAAIMPPMAAQPPKAQIVMMPPAAPTPAAAEPPSTQTEIAVVMPRVPMPPKLPQPEPKPEPVMAMDEPAMPAPELPQPVKLQKPAAPAKPTVDPTQTRLISSGQSRMLEQNEQSAITVIR